MLSRTPTMPFCPTRLILAATLLASTLIAAPLLAQSPSQTSIQPMAANAHPTFAVATIKPHDPTSPHQGFNTEGRRITIRNESLTKLLMFAYAIHKRQIADLPDWASGTDYDIVGTTDTPGEPSLRQFQEMIQKLLADRFQLTFHREKRNMPVFAITIAKGGPKLTPAAEPNAEADDFNSANGTEQTIRFKSATVADFALNEQFFLERPVVDQTGLTARYDFTLRYTRDETAAPDPDAPPGLFTAIQEQLGLKFQPTKAPIDVLVIDHIARPSAN
jgi:uncharacterized protein (TIGR03435 family)